MISIYLTATTESHFSWVTCSYLRILLNIISRITLT